MSYEYISNFKKELKEKKIKYKTNPAYWFSLHRSREKKIFESDKLITPQLQNLPNFTIDENKFYPDAGGYVVAKRSTDNTPLKVYLGLFNSKLFYYFIKSTSTSFNNNYYYFKTNYIEPFGIPPISEVQSKLIEQQVIKIISIKALNPNESTQELENSIDVVVYKLYNLTYSEACLIEGNTEWMSEEEYNNFL